MEIKIQAGLEEFSGFSKTQVSLFFIISSIVLFLKKNYSSSKIILRSHPGSDDSILAKELDIYFDDGNMPINTFLKNNKIFKIVKSYLIFNL